MTPEEKLQYDGDGSTALLNLAELQRAGLIRLTKGSIDVGRVTRKLEDCKARGYVPDEHKIEGWQLILARTLGVVPLEGGRN